MTLQLDNVQAAMLVEILESDLGDLRAEISHTDSPDFREHLKKKEVFIKDALAMLAAGLPGSSD